MIFNNGSKAIGIDIGSESIRAVELSRGKYQAKITRIGSIKLVKGLVVDGEISEPTEVARSLKQLWREAGFQGKKVTIGVANPKVIARQVELPYMEADALAGAIRFQAQEYVPISPQNLILDYHIMGESVEDGQKMLKVLLVAAHRDMIESFTRTIEQAGLTPWVVYLSSLALVRALVKPPPVVMPDQTGDSTVIVNMGAGLSNVVVVDQGTTRFARVITFGGDDLTKAIADLMGIDEEEAEQLKIAYGLPEIKRAPEEVMPPSPPPASPEPVPVQPMGVAYPVQQTVAQQPMTQPPTPQAPVQPAVSLAGGSYEQPIYPDTGWSEDQPDKEENQPDKDNASSQAGGEQAEKVRDLLQREAYKFIDEVRRSVEYYFSQDISTLNIDKIILTGGAAQMRNLPDFISEALGIDVQIGNPFEVASLDERLVKKGVLERISPLSLAAAVGLGLRGLEK